MTSVWDLCQRSLEHLVLLSLPRCLCNILQRQIGSLMKAHIMGRLSKELWLLISMYWQSSIVLGSKVTRRNRVTQQEASHLKRILPQNNFDSHREIDGTSQ